MARGSTPDEILYGDHFRRTDETIEAERIIVFTTAYEGRQEKWYSLQEWWREQTQFDDREDCYEILEYMLADGGTTWADVNYQIGDVQEFRRQLADIPSPWEL